MNAKQLQTLVRKTNPGALNEALKLGELVQDRVYRAQLKAGVSEPEARERAIEAGDLAFHWRLT